MNTEVIEKKEEPIEVTKEVIDGVTISPLPLDREKLVEHIQSEVKRLVALPREEFEAEMQAALRQTGKTGLVGEIMNLAIQERVRRDMASVGIDLNKAFAGKKIPRPTTPIRTPSLKSMFPGLGSKAKSKK